MRNYTWIGFVTPVKLFSYLPRFIPDLSQTSNIMSTQQALWLPCIGQGSVVNTKEIHAPRPRELPVKAVWAL